MLLFCCEFLLAPSHYWRCKPNLHSKFTLRVKSFIYMTEIVSVGSLLSKTFEIHLKNV